MLDPKSYTGEVDIVDSPTQGKLIVLSCRDGLKDIFDTNAFAALASKLGTDIVNRVSAAVNPSPKAYFG